MVTHPPTHPPTHSLSLSRWRLLVVLQVKCSQSSENTVTMMLFLLSDGMNLYLLKILKKNLLLFKHKSIKMLQNFQYACIRTCCQSLQIFHLMYEHLYVVVYPRLMQSNSHNSNVQSYIHIMDIWTYVILWARDGPISRWRLQSMY